MQELWKPIKNYEGLYEISNLGNVKSLDKIVYCTNQYGTKATRIRKGKQLKLAKQKNGYMSVSLNSKTFKVHRLVAEAFISNPNSFLQVNHKDGDKTNNSVDNLEWCDSYYNMQHAVKTGLFHKFYGKDNWQSKKIECSNNKIKKYIIQ